MIPHMVVVKVRTKTPGREILPDTNSYHVLETTMEGSPCIWHLRVLGEIEVVSLSDPQSVFSLPMNTVNDLVPK